MSEIIDGNTLIGIPQELEKRFDTRRYDNGIIEVYKKPVISNLIGDILSLPVIRVIEASERIYGISINL